MAGALAERPGGPLGALGLIERFSPSPQREVLKRTLFLQTPARSYENNARLVSAMARFMAGAGDAGPSVHAEPSQALAEALSSPSGRALLLDARVSGVARLWAAREVMARNPAVTSALRTPSPWREDGLLEAHAAARAARFAARGDAPVEVSGKNIENLIGAGLGAPVAPISWTRRYVGAAASCLASASKSMGLR